MCIPNRLAFRVVLRLKEFYIRCGIGHIVLLLSYAFYLLLFATSFYIVEKNSSQRALEEWRSSLARHRTRFITNEVLPQIFNNSDVLVFIHADKSLYLSRVLGRQLEHYERLIDHKPPITATPITFMQSVHFAFTSCTTISHSHIRPLSYQGRMVSLGFSIAGIAFTLIVIREIEHVITRILSCPCILLAQLWHAIRFCMLRNVADEAANRKLKALQKQRHNEYQLDTVQRLLLMPITVCVLAVIGWVGLGCALTNYYIPEVRPHIAAYWTIITLTTIGPSEVILEDPLMLLAFIAYVLLGFSIVSLFINLLHAKFSRHCWLSGPMYLPLPSQAPLVACDSFDGSSAYTDSLSFRYTTLGIFQAEDQSEAISKIRRRSAKQDAATQTPNIHAYPPWQGTRLLPGSRDDVNSLIVETYADKSANNWL